MPVTVVSYGSAISACEKGLQYRQCLEYLDEMTEMGIKKNVIIFGAAMSCMEKSCRADIGFLLMERMRLEDVAPNVHIYNSAISACARCNLWEKGYELFEEMDRIRVAKDVVTYNAVLDAVSSQVELGRRLFKEGVEKGFYARVSRLGTQWLELDLHFLSLGGGEIALGWWFEECLVPYLVNTSKLEAVQSISIVTGYGKTRSRGARMNDDGMRLRVRAMLKYMDIHETPQPNKGRIHIDKEALIEVVKKNGGRIKFDLEGYNRFKEEETTANKFPEVAQKVRPRFRPARPGQGPPGTFIRDGDPVPPYKSPEEDRRESMMDSSMRRPNDNGYPEYHDSGPSSSRNPRDDRGRERSFDSGRPSGDDRSHGRGPNNYDRNAESWNHEPRNGDEWRGGPRDAPRDAPRDVPRDAPRRDSFNDQEGHGRRGYRGDRPENGMDRRGTANRDFHDNRPRMGNEGDRRNERHQEMYDRRGSTRSWEGRSNDYDQNAREFDRNPRPPMNRNDQPSSYYPEDRRNSFGNRSGSSGFRGAGNETDYESAQYQKQQGPPSRGYDVEPSYTRGEPESPSNGGDKKRSYDDYQKQQPPPSRGYDVQPAYAKRRGSS